MRTDCPHPRRRLGRHGAALVLLIAADTGALAQAAQDAIVFPEVTMSRRHGLDPGTDLRRRDIEPALDLFYSGDFGRWRMLGEVFLSDDESEIERLQLGWSLDADNTLWLGRFHNPLGYWNTQFHHGTYLQTSISRPGIHEYEDEGGALPAHLAGALWEGAHARDGAEWRYAAALGAGPELRGTLDPVNIFSPGEGRHRLGATARFAFAPRAHDADEAGVFIGSTRLPGDGNPFTEVRQTVSGAYANWKLGELRVLGEAFFVHTRLEQSGGRSAASFASGYLQLEYLLGQSWMLYGRAEGSAGARDDAYLARFPLFVQRRELVGLRYELTRRQALKFELSEAHLFADSYRQATLQWSAGFP